MGEDADVDALGAADEAIERAAAETNYNKAVARGEFSNSWVDAILEDSGVTINGTGN